MDKLQKKIASVTSEPGVYVFKDGLGQVLYVGKAKNLKARIKTYFRPKELTGKIIRLASEIRDLQVIPTTGEFEAILLEAKLIRSYQPKYNVVARDDKSPLYLVLTLSEDLPRLILARRPQLSLFNLTKNVVFGPFPSARLLRNMLRGLRKAIPFCLQKRRDGKPCLYTHLGLCQPCPSVIAQLPADQAHQELTRKYRQNIFRLRDVFSGNIRSVITSYERGMKAAAAQLKFEEAAIIKERIATLYRLVEQRYDPEVFLDYGAENVYQRELKDLRQQLAMVLPELKSLSRIECIDISHFGGQATVGSLIVLHEGKPDKQWYRRFRIRTVAGISDTAAIAELLKRRLTHPEWPKPDLLLIDGGKPQLGAALKVLSHAKINLPVVGLAKRYEEIVFFRPTGYFSLHLPVNGWAIKVLQRARDESHRFALAYHKLIRRQTSPESSTIV